MRYNSGKFFGNRAWLASLLVLLTLAGCGGSDSPVPAALAITAQPSDTSVMAGSVATLSVVASRADALYQWQRSPDGGSTWSNLAGATQSRYTTPPATAADDGLRFRVVVSVEGASITSSAVRLTVTAAVVAPAITVAPAPVTVTAPGNASFSVTATGTALLYQWQRSISGSAEWNDASGATSATFDVGATTAAMSGDRFRVIVSNDAGRVTSDVAALTVLQAPVLPAFATEPADQSVIAGGSAAFSVVVSGTPAPTLQWQRSTNGGATFADIAGATDLAYTIAATTLSQDGERYRAVATNLAGSATSSAVLLTVNAAPLAPAITANPTSQTVTAPSPATFNAAASGVPTPTWQWQVSTDGGTTFTNITGATSASYTTPATSASDNGKRYRAVASNSAGVSNSSAAVLMVTAPVAAPGWQGLPELLSIGTQTGPGPAISVYAADSAGSDNSALAVWTQYDASSIAKINAKRFVPGAGWAGPVEVSTHALATQSAFDAKVVTDSLNQSIVVWQLRDDVSNTRRAIARRYTPAGGWETPVTLSSGILSGGEAEGIAVKVDAIGNAVVTWVQRVTALSPWQVFAARYSGATGWSTAERIDNNAIGQPGQPQVAMGPAGHAFVVWPAAGSVAGAAELWSSRTAAGGTWDAPVLLGQTPISQPQVSIAVNNVGDALAAWSELDNTGFTSIRSRLYRAGVGWGSTEAVETDNFNRATNPRVVVQGNLWLAMWVQFTAAGEQVFVNRYIATVGEGWGATPQAVVTGAINSFGSPSIALSSSGSAAVSWKNNNESVWARMRGPDGAWGTPQQAAKTAADGTSYAVISGDPQAAIDSMGNATVVWQGASVFATSTWIFGGRFR